MGWYVMNPARWAFAQIVCIASSGVLCGALGVERPETVGVLNDVTLKEALIIGHPDGDFSLRMVLSITGKEPVRVVFGPWHTAFRADFVICQDGKPVGGTMGTPMDNEPFVPLKPGETTYGGVLFRGFGPGRYDMVGLVYCIIERPDRSKSTIALPIPYLSFDLDPPASNTVIARVRIGD